MARPEVHFLDFATVFTDTCNSNWRGEDGAIKFRKLVVREL